MSSIAAEDLDFSNESLKVISSAQKYIIPVPALPGGGEPLVYPEGHEKAGQQIADWQGNPIGDRGIVFFNGKDKSVQAVPGDGNGVIIINQVDEKQAAKLGLKMKLCGEPVTADKLKSLLGFARENMGLGDMYNSDRGFVAAKMTSAGPAGPNGAGLFKRDDRDICLAVRLEGKGEFQGPAATPQVFDDGAVIVKQGNDVRLVQPQIFLETYRNADGTQLALDDIPLGRRADMDMVA